MPYNNLQELINHNSSTRAYFLSLPVDMQIRLHEYGDYINSAQSLRNAVSAISDIKHIEDSGMR